MAKHEKAADWLGIFDNFSNAMYSDGDFALHQYLPYLLVPFYPLFNERGGPRVERNHTDWEVRPVIIILSPTYLVLDHATDERE
jgi:chromosome transmission fidelity protein 18